jgi:hypothetical protein
MTQPCDEPPELPPLETGVVDAETLRRLFFDLASSATVLSVQLKGASDAHATSAPRDLAGARDALLAGTVAGIQIRYVHEGTEWWDTVLRSGDADGTFRVVRFRPGLP